MTFGSYLRKNYTQWTPMPLIVYNMSTPRPIPEYHEYMRRLAHLNSTFTTTTSNPTTSLNSLIKINNFTTTETKMDPFKNIQFPSPCKDIEHGSIWTVGNLYCIGLMALWLMLMIYHFRSLLKIKTIVKEKINNYYEESIEKADERQSNRKNSPGEQCDKKNFPWCLSGGQDTAKNIPLSVVVGGESRSGTR